MKESNKNLKVNSRKIKAFQSTVWEYYKQNRRDMPWRNTSDPYHILVSEVMLQQTQVPRVMEKYPEFLRIFPTVLHLAQARLSEVIRVWQGMGYNRRAKFLKQAAEQIQHIHNGSVPDTYEVLCALPGIGPSTAGGVLAFAFNQPVVFIETNVRRVFLYHFFKDRQDVTDAEIYPLVENTLDPEHPREWYYALFDYGTYLGQTKRKNPNTRSKHYNKQSPFTGSNREVRGTILKLLSQRACSDKHLSRQLRVDMQKKLKGNLAALESEGFVHREGNIYMLKQ